MSDLLVARDGAVLQLTLNRPEKRNATTLALLDALRNEFVAAQDDGTVRALVLTGSGSAFCAGQDLADPAVKPGEDLGDVVKMHHNPLVRAMFALDKPIVAAVNGVAAGAGASLAFACDIVIAARSAWFIEAFSKIGLLPDSGGTWTLPRLVGRARATGMTMLGERIDAQRALEWGAIWSVVDDEKLAEETTNIAQTLAAMPTRALGATKRALAASLTTSLDEQLELEAALQSHLGKTHDFVEGVTAFREKRAPSFKGA